MLNSKPLQCNRISTGDHAITRNSSGDETANVNFLYNDIVHTLQNIIDSRINSVTNRRCRYVFEHRFTKFTRHL